MKKMSFSGVVLVVLLALSAGLSALALSAVAGAQGPASQGSAGPQTMLGTAFTYQGELRKDGNPVDATCTMAFRLYDDPAAGNQVGEPITLTVTVDDGLFTALLNSAGQFGPAFFGEARWLEVAVKCPGDLTFHTLSPRQALTAAPYALSLRPGAVIDGAVPGSSALAAVNRADSGNGVLGWASATSSTTYGVYGGADSDFGTGVEGTAPRYGVRGVATSSSGYTYGVIGQADSTYGFGVYGYATADSGATHGVWGQVDSTNGIGVRGRATATSGATWGVYGTSNSPDGIGVYGESTATSGDAPGVLGVSWASAAPGVYGFVNTPSGDAAGVLGLSMSTTGRGVRGWASATTGSAIGVYGQADSTEGYGVYGGGPAIGVYGRASATSGTTSGVYGRSDSPDGRGTVGWATAVSGEARGVYGRSDSTQGSGVCGYATAGTGTAEGVYGVSDADQGRGVYGRTNGTTALASGVLGEAYYGLANGVAGIVWTTTGTGVGVFGQTHSPSGYAGYFSGNVHVNGTLTAAVKQFKIDHPLDPANQYLYHYSVESSEVLNQYSGNVYLGADGSAWVELPAWFSAINRDFRYQLTAIGAPAPGLYVAQEVRDNRFQIAGGPPGLKVSWELTALRSDPYILRHGAPVEEQKTAGERGTYLFPELYGQPEELGRDYPFLQSLRSAHYAVQEETP